MNYSLLDLVACGIVVLWMYLYHTAQFIHCNSALICQQNCK